MSQIPKNTVGSRKDPKRGPEGEQPSVVPIRGTDALENTMPPTPLRELLAAEGASVYVRTDETGLFETVEQGGGEQYPVYLADSWQTLREAITEGRCGIALLDIDTVSGSLIDRLSELASLNPALVILLASTRDRADGLLDLLSQRKIHRLLIKPPTVGITRLLLESSVNRHMELRRRPDLQARPDAARASGFPRWPSWLLAGGLVLGLLAAVAVTTYFTRSAPVPATVTNERAAQPLPPGAAAASSPTLSPATTRPIDADVNELAPGGTGELGEAGLPNAPVAIAGPFPVTGFEPVPPAGPSAEELDSRYAEVEAALVAEDLDMAAELLAALETVDAESARLAFLNSQLERARAAAELAAAAQAAALAAEAAANPSELTSLIGLARARLAQGQIDAPAGDSAVAYLARARGVDPSAREVAALTDEVGAALVEAARTQLAGGQIEAAEELFLGAQGLGVTGNDLAALELGLTVAREAQAQAEQDALLASARERLAQGLLSEPAGASALDAVLAVRQLDPDYPGLPATSVALEAALTAAAETALEAGTWDSADATIEALARLGTGSAVLDELRGDAQFGRQQEAYLAAAAPAAELEVLEFAPPAYPARALNRGTQGWVDLEFIVDRDGRPRDLVVTAAEPPDEFDAAALAAVGDYVFVPFERDGRVFERRVSLRLRFALQ